MAEEKRVVDGIIDFLNEAGTPFHAVHAAAKRLRAAGFTQLVEAEAWALEKGGRYFFTRNETTIVAFAVGARFDPLRDGGRSGFTVIGAHTDSPCPKLKPVSKLSKGGHLMLSVVGYGGGLWHTWFDRDLSLAGRVLVRSADGSKMESHLVRIPRPILRIPNLAIHLQSDDERRGFGPNLQNHFPPVLASEVKAQLEAPAVVAATAKDDDAATKESPVAEHHHALLLRLLGDELGVAPERIADFELQLVDTQPSTVGGALREFVFSGRLDNLASSYQALTALVDSCSGGAGALQDEPNVRLVALFDHEEIGSVSAQGAASSLMPEVLQRITQTLAGSGGQQPDVLSRVLRRSYIVSADMAHALHPNYADKHDPGLQPKMHGGLVIKHNVNQRYATNAVTAHIFRELARGFAKVPVQEFAVRADSRCGSTIGPRVRTVDVGSPQWAMHSVRECMATSDVYHGYKHFRAVYEHFSTVAAQCAEMYDA